MNAPLLQAYIGFVIIGSIRGLFLIQYRKRRERTVPDYNHDSERQPLLDQWPSLIHDVERGSPLKAKITCVLGALSYIAATVYSKVVLIW